MCQAVASTESLQGVSNTVICLMIWQWLGTASHKRCMAYCDRLPLSLLRKHSDRTAVRDMRAGHYQPLDIWGGQRGPTGAQGKGKTLKKVEVESRKRQCRSWEIWWYGPQTGRAGVYFKRLLELPSSERANRQGIKGTEDFYLLCQVCWKIFINKHVSSESFCFSDLHSIFQEFKSTELLNMLLFTCIIHVYRHRSHN